jgi:hypothetical protein
LVVAPRKNDDHGDNNNDNDDDDDNNDDNNKEKEVRFRKPTQNIYRSPVFGFYINNEWLLTSH